MSNAKPKSAPATNNVVAKEVKGSYVLNPEFSGPVASTDKEYWRRDAFASALLFERVTDDQLKTDLRVRRDNSMFAVGMEIRADEVGNEHVVAGSNELGIAYIILRKPSEKQARFSSLLIYDVVFNNGLKMRNMRIEMTQEAGKLVTDLQFNLYTPEGKTQQERSYPTSFCDKNDDWKFKNAVLTLVDKMGILKFDADATRQVRQAAKNDAAAETVPAGAAGTTGQIKE